MVASISTCRFALVITRSMNSCTFSCWRAVARTVTMPDSGLTMTEAASRKVVLLTICVPVVCRVAAFGLPASDAGALCRRVVLLPVCAPEPVVVCRSSFSITVSLDPSGRILSVSRRMSLMFFSSDSQKRFLPVLRTSVVELFEPPSAEIPTLPLPDEEEPLPPR